MYSVSPSRSSRIAVLVHSMNEGGAQKRLVSLANRFAERGHDVDLVAVCGSGTAGRLVSGSVRQIALDGSGKRPLVRLVAGLGALTDYLEQERPAVLLAGSNRVHVVAALALARLKAPPLLVLRAARHPLRHLPWSRPWKRLREYGLRPIERWAYRRADLIIAVSEEGGESIRGLVADPAKVIVIPNPTITRRFRASLEQLPDHRWFDAAAEGGDPVIVAVGRMSQQKDFETLIRAVAIANRSRPLRLLMLGDGSRRAALEALVAQRGLGDRVDMLGHVDGVGGWLARADMLVSSSLWEGSPGAVIEAFAAGCPVVATSCPGGSVELLRCSVGGKLVPMRDPEAMAAAILAMLERPRDRAALRALAMPYEDDGRADLHYLESIEAAEERRAAASSGAAA